MASITRDRVRRGVIAAAVVACAALLSGCFAGAMIQEYQRHSTKTVAAEYTGLEGKSFAVVISADRSIQADNPRLVDELTSRITERLSGSANVPCAGGYVPADQVLKYLYNHPGWASMSRVELAKALGGGEKPVERLVYIDLYEYRLTDAGNQYEWNGVAAGNLSVFEIDSALPNESGFDRTIQVKYPDKQGYGPNEMSQVVVTSALAKRFIDRASWLFYRHDEPYMPDY